MSAQLKKFGAFSLFAVFFTVLHGSFAFAQTNEVNDVARNMVSSVQELPALVSAFSYLLGLLLGVLGVLKIKDHVENPTQTPLRVGLIRLLAGGALISLPIIYEASFRSIGTDALGFDNGAIANDMSALFGGLSGLVPTLNFNNILANILNAIEEVPALISAVAYLLGLVIVVQAILKAKDHVENPDQTALRESVVRFLVGGALFALPSIYNAMFDLAGGNGLGILGNVSSVLGGLGFFRSGYGGGLLGGVCNPIAGFGGGSMGDVLCTMILHTGAFPAFLSACGYIIGLVLGLWGIFKLRDHVLNPQQTAVWEGVSRLIAGGFFFALPIVVEVARSTLSPGALAVFSLAPTPAGYNETVGACTGGFAGLDQIVSCMMSDMLTPLHVVLNFFTFCAGFIFLMIGVSRLIKSSQDGARGPGGIGTIMTFVTGAALISYNDMVRAFSTTLMGNPFTATYAKLDYTTGMAAAELATAHTTISAILKFVIIVGLISFVRGIFIIRGVAEGNQQSSIMAGLTHIIAGALAVNLGPLLNAVQQTLGLVGFGITFS